MKKVDLEFIGDVTFALGAGVPLSPERKVFKNEARALGVGDSAFVTLEEWDSLRYKSKSGPASVLASFYEKTGIRFKTRKCVAPLGWLVTRIA